MQPILEQLTWFIKKPTQFTQSNIVSDIAALMPMFSVNGPLRI